jgi:hypothetical protein
MAKKYHPDTNKSPEAQKRFVEVSRAYEVFPLPLFIYFPAFPLLLSALPYLDLDSMRLCDVQVFL